jgi:hypothetical protein
MLATTLNTNEVKQRAGTEVEFQHLAQNDRSTEFGQITETPVGKHRLKVSHQEIGTGVEMRRRSASIITKKVAGVSGTYREIKATVNLDIPVGDLATYDDVKDVLAEVGSFCFTAAGSTTFQYDGSGTGAAALLSGGL